jgi:hypothetical protein
MTASIWSLAPITIGSTTIGVMSYTLPQAVLAQLSQHSGNEYPTLIAVPGSNPRLRFRAHLHDALNLIGLTVLSATTCSAYLAKFESFARSSNSVHMKLALSTSCTAAVQIDSIGVDQDGIAFAECSAVYLSNDGAAHPLTLTTSNALPALSAAAVVHTLGPSVLNGSGIPAVASVSGDLNQELVAQRSDGDKYPRIAARMGGQPRLTIPHKDPVAVLAALGLDGANVTSNFVQYFRRFDATTGVVGASSGISITIASGRAHPTQIEAEHGAIAGQAIEVIGLSATSTHPFALSLSATVPAAA